MFLRVLKTLVFAVMAPGSVTVLIPALILGGGGSVSLEPGWTLALGVVPVVIGAALLAWSFSRFVVEGRGTPAPYDPPVSLVIRGPYRWVRNPMYVGLVAVLLGEAAVLRSIALLAYAVAVWLAFHVFVVLYEEPVLRRRFSDAYEEYARSVPRWIPRPPR